MIGHVRLSRMIVCEYFLVRLMKNILRKLGNSVGEKYMTVNVSEVTGISLESLYNLPGRKQEKKYPLTFGTIPTERRVGLPSSINWFINAVRTAFYSMIFLYHNLGRETLWTYQNDPFHWRFVHRNSNSIEKFQFDLTQNWTAWSLLSFAHDTTNMMSCMGHLKTFVAMWWSVIIITEKWSFHRIWIMKNFVYNWNAFVYIFSYILRITKKYAPVQKCDWFIFHMRTKRFSQD